jgi:UDPglucose 6-dehydrogenase
MADILGVVGLWHLGCVIASSWASRGYEVRAVDPDDGRIRDLKRGIPPLYEPHLSESIRENLAAGRIRFSATFESLGDCDFVFLAYDTPVLDDDRSDTGLLEETVKRIGPFMKQGGILIVSSQSPVGFCGHLRRVLGENQRGLELAYSPENLRLGEALECYKNPGRIVLGSENKATESRCVGLLSRFEKNVICMNLTSAELTKHAINSFLAASIVFVNSLADLCEDQGAKIDDVVRGMKSDPRIGARAYLSPGIGFSGGTLGRDLKALDEVNRRQTGSAGYFGLLHELNGARKKSILAKIDRILGGLKGHRIGLLGITYKAGTSTLRRSLPLEIARLLVGQGARVVVYDPQADYGELEGPPEFGAARTIEEAAREADLLVLMTDWEEFKSADWAGIQAGMKKPDFLDTKNFLSREAMEKIGFRYRSLGRG